MTKKIALVDDDRNILTSVSIALETEGYIVRTYNDGEAGLNGILEEPPDLAVLDIKMPRLDGFGVLEKLRQSLNIPVIFLTSRDEEDDELQGLRLGADDYVKKPFSQALLLERIRILLRRTDNPDGPAKDKRVLHVSNLVMDDRKQFCSWQDHPVELSATEYALLKALAERPGHIKSRDQLIDAAYGETLHVDDRTIDSHIKRVRQKIRKLDPEFNRIETVYGAGYKFRET